MKFKGLIAVIGIAGMLCSMPVHAENDIKVYVDNKVVEFTDQTPEIVDGRTLVPVRAVFEQAGAKVEWDGETSTATLTRGGYTVKITVGEAFLTKNGKPMAIDVAACILNERLAIPVRAIAEAMDFGVVWNSTRSSVLINTEGKEYRPNAFWKTGFLPVEEAGFIVTGRLNDVQYFDLEGDGVKDTIGFIPTTETTYAGLWLNGNDVSEVLDRNMDAYAIGVVDFGADDVYKEIAVLYNTEDGKCLGVYRYNGTDLFHVKSNNSDDGMIYYNGKIFVDNCNNIVSDVDGLCFLNDILCTGMYSLEDGGLVRYTWKSLDSAVDISYLRTYTDNAIFSYKEVKEYNKGKYVDQVVDNEVIYSNDIAGFKVLDYYVDSTDPSKFEFFVEFADGTKAVLWPYIV